MTSSTSMRRAPLGSSGPVVSAVGIGTMSWPGSHYGEEAPPATGADREAAREMTRVALDEGINLFDTADGYGRGRAEELLGGALRELGRRDEAVIVTKVGPLFDGERKCNLSEASIRRRCEASLRRLGTERIDVYLAHHPDPLTPPAETVGTFEALRKEGKIAHFGLSNHSPSQIAEARRLGAVTAVQHPYSLIDRGLEAETIPVCLREGIGIQAFSPLAKGILSGKYRADLLPSDYRLNRFHFAPDRLEAHLALADRCRAWAEKLGVIPSQVAMAWCLARPGITVVLPGTKDASQVRESAVAGRITLPPEAVAELAG